MNQIRGLRGVARIAVATLFLAVIGCSTTRSERSIGEYVDDQTLSRRVKHALNTQPVYKYPDIHVQTFRGVVQLSGFVATEAQRLAATEIVERVRGVREIENAIGLTPLAEGASDEFIPGRDTNTVTRTFQGSAGRQTTVTSGTVTRFTNSVDGVRR